MKRLIALFMAVILAASLCACGSSSDSLSTLPHAIKKSEREPLSATEPKNESTTELPTKASSEIATQPESQAKNEPEKFTSDDLVLCDVTGSWNHVETNGHHSINITEQNGNTITMTIQAIRGQASQIAIADVTVNMVVDAAGGVMSDNLGGKGTFTYEDSFLNQGQGEIIIYGPNNLTLYLNQTSDSSGGWGIGAAAGDYTKY